MEIRFTKHAQEKFGFFLRHGVQISHRQVIDAVCSPESVDHISRFPLSIAQSKLDQHHVLRVVYRREENMMVIITFYPGRKSQYDEEK